MIKPFRREPAPNCLSTGLLFHEARKAMEQLTPSPQSPPRLFFCVSGSPSASLRRLSGRLEFGGSRRVRGPEFGGSRSDGAGCWGREHGLLVVRDAQIGTSHGIGNQLRPEDGLSIERRLHGVGSVSGWNQEHDECEKGRAGVGGFPKGRARAVDCKVSAAGWRYIHCGREFGLPTGLRNLDNEGDSLSICDDDGARQPRSR